jgi:hypothetical protein
VAVVLKHFLARSNFCALYRSNYVAYSLVVQR